jgi:hypothetical protein
MREARNAHHFEIETKWEDIEINHKELISDDVK